MQATSTRQRKPLRLSPEMLMLLACPHDDRASLTMLAGEDVLACSVCGRRFPVIDGVPILINDEASAFRIADYAPAPAGGGETASAPRGFVKTVLNRLTPSPSIRSADFDAGAAIAEVAGETPRPRILVIGCGDARFSYAGDLELVYTDVLMTPTTQIICDAHDLPFQGASFDAVLAIGVLEHVADPVRCTREIHRVLKPRGFVYAETPFMQQVHLGAYDFGRFTKIGHRRLFRQFEDTRSGIVGGPAMTLAWSFEYFLSSFSEKAFARRVLRATARIAMLPIKHLDRFLVRKRGAVDGASCFYFFGRKSADSLSDREILRAYDGLNPG